MKQENKNWDLIKIVIVIIIIFSLAMIFDKISSPTQEQIEIVNYGKDLCERIQLMDFVKVERLNNGKIEVTCRACSETKIVETDDLKKYDFKSCDEYKFIIEPIDKPIVKTNDREIPKYICPDLSDEELRILGVDENTNINVYDFEECNSIHYVYGDKEIIKKCKLK